MVHSLTVLNSDMSKLNFSSKSLVQARQWMSTQVVTRLCEPNSQLRGKYIRNNLISIRVSLICKLSGIPD
jgi:hypothetical protein